MTYIYGLAVVFIFLILCNMVIAVLGDTYNKHNDNKDMVAKTAKFSLLSAANPMLPKWEKWSKTKEDEPVFMIVIQPVDDECAKEDDWHDDAGLNLQSMKDSINDLETNLIKMQNKFKSDIEVEMIREQ